jgi:hypothetical protein
MSFVLFIAGLLAVIVSVVVSSLRTSTFGTSELADTWMILSYYVYGWGEVLALVLGVIGCRHRLGAIGATGAAIMLVLEFLVGLLFCTLSTLSVVR